MSLCNSKIFCWNMVHIGMYMPNWNYISTATFATLRLTDLWLTYMSTKISLQFEDCIIVDKISKKGNFHCSYPKSLQKKKAILKISLTWPVVCNCINILVEIIIKIRSYFNIWPIVRENKLAKLVYVLQC